MTTFKDRTPLIFRKEECQRILSRYPGRIPIICEKDPKSDIKELPKSKYLVPDDLTVGQFMYVIRKNIELAEEKAIYLFIENQVIPPNSDLMSSVYWKYRNKEDGLLYIFYASESFFG